MEGIAYLCSVLPYAVCVGLALRPPQRPGALGTVSHLLGFLAAALPQAFAGYFVVVTALAGVQGELGSATGLLGLVVSVAATVGLAVMVVRAVRARGVLARALADAGLPGTRRPGRAPIGVVGQVLRCLLPPFGRRRRGVERVTDIAYGSAARRQRLDVYRRRRRTAQHAPVLVHFHGGRFVSGAKSRETAPVFNELAARGWVVVSADYRVRGPFPTAHDDAVRALDWVRRRIGEHGGDPRTVVAAGDSAGAHLASYAALTADPATQPVAVVGLSGYYGRLDARPETSPAAHARPDAPPFLLLHGDRDPVVPVAWARDFAEALRSVSQASVVLAELPGAPHTIDFFAGPRTRAVADAIEDFTAGAHMPHPAARS